MRDITHDLTLATGGFRSVAEEDKSIALGIQSSMTSLLAWIPAPILYGVVIDSTCNIWEYPGGSEEDPDWWGYCMEYDNNDYRYKSVPHLWLFVLFKIPIFPVRDRGICSLVNRDTLLELRSEWRSDALPVSTIDFSGFWTQDPLLWLIDLAKYTTIYWLNINFRAPRCSADGQKTSFSIVTWQTFAQCFFDCLYKNIQNILWKPWVVLPPVLHDLTQWSLFVDMSWWQSVWHL